MTPTENEMTPAGAVAPNRSGVASGTIPEAVSSTTGVSLRYAPVPKGEWFVFRASYNRELKAADFILNEGIYAYVPQQYVWKEKDGKPKKELKSLISCKFFVYTDAKTAQKLAKDTPELSYCAAAGDGAVPARLSDSQRASLVDESRRDESQTQ